MGIKYTYALGQTPLDEDESRGLKMKSISTQSELDEFEQMNIEKAVEWTIKTRLSKETILSKKFIQDLHKRMFGDVWIWAGQFRKTNKNLGIKWPQIETEVQKLLDDTNYWIKNQSYSPPEIALRFKHRIVSIHCFPNGNGRHSRMMADVIMESIFKQHVFTWHQSQNSKPNEIRQKYISALKQADNGDIQALIEFACT